jgi:hypothetical protein
VNLGDGIAADASGLKDLLAAQSPSAGVDLGSVWQQDLAQQPNNTIHQAYLINPEDRNTIELLDICYSNKLCILPQRFPTAKSRTQQMTSLYPRD